MLTMKETEAAYARFLSEPTASACRRTRTRCSHNLKSSCAPSTKPKQTAISPPLPPPCSGW